MPVSYQKAAKCWEYKNEQHVGVSDLNLSPQLLGGKVTELGGGNIIPKSSVMGEDGWVGKVCTKWS